MSNDHLHLELSGRSNRRPRFADLSHRVPHAITRGGDVRIYRDGRRGLPAAAAQLHGPRTDRTGAWTRAPPAAARRSPGARPAPGAVGSRRQGRPEMAWRKGRIVEVLGLYVHVPFCSAICNYCNFNRGLFDEALKTRYVDALVREIARAGSAMEVR